MGFWSCQTRLPPANLWLPYHSVPALWRPSWGALGSTVGPMAVPWGCRHQGAQRGAATSVLVKMPWNHGAGIPVEWGVHRRPSPQLFLRRNHDRGAPTLLLSWGLSWPPAMGAGRGKGPKNGDMRPTPLEALPHTSTQWGASPREGTHSAPSLSSDDHKNISHE